MATSYITSDIVETGTVIVLPHDEQENGDEIVVQAGVLVASSDFDAIRGAWSNHNVIVNGTVSGDLEGGIGVYLGFLLTDTDNAVSVSAQGSVYGNVGVALWGSGSSLENDGHIHGTKLGVMLGSGAGGNSAVMNGGVMAGGEMGVAVAPDSTGTVEFTNLGRLKGTELAYSGADIADLFVNRGVVLGDIRLGGGSDLYDGRGGSLEGLVHGEGGDDLFVAGDEAEAFDGGTGVDTLDFRSGDGLQVSLLDDSGTGRAAGDVYTNFENVIGSAQGADTLSGSDSGNRLEGRGGSDSLLGNGGADVLLGGQGNDRLVGGAGKDTLTGGTGKDSLTGGNGDDAFMFSSSAEAGDLVSDFRNLSGNNDRFHIDVSSFGGGLVAGSALAEAQFQIRDDNLALDSNDRFIFEKDATKLWFDSNGTASGGLLLVADLQAGATMTAADIWLF